MSKKVRTTFRGLKGIVQIKDDLVVYRKGDQHDQRLDKLLERCDDDNVKLRVEKCKFGQDKVKWFGNVYTKHGMSPDLDNVDLIKAWPRPEDKTVVESFLQTVQFCRKFMRPSAGKTY